LFFSMLFKRWHLKNLKKFPLGIFSFILY
jgi:hypothetical protein